MRTGSFHLIVRRYATRPLVQGFDICRMGPWSGRECCRRGSFDASQSDPHTFPITCPNRQPSQPASRRRFLPNKQRKVTKRFATFLSERGRMRQALQGPWRKTSNPSKGSIRTNLYLRRRFARPLRSSSQDRHHPPPDSRLSLTRRRGRKYPGQNTTASQLRLRQRYTNKERRPRLHNRIIHTVPRERQLPRRPLQGNALKDRQRSKERPLPLQL